MAQQVIVQTPESGQTGSVASRAQAGTAVPLPAPTPASIVSLAWAISGKYSKNAEEQEKAQEAESYFQDIRNQLSNSYFAYMDEISSILLGNSRTFALICRHRDYLFDRIEVLKKNKITEYQQLESFTGSLQGIFPRLSGIAIGGTTIPLLISKAFPSISSSTSTLLIVAFGGVGYIISELISSYIGGTKLNQSISYYEDQKDSVYQEFLNKSKSALLQLLDNVIRSYQLYVNSTYNLSANERKNTVDDIMKPAVPS